ncbi:hypothetical protein BDY17DRAFT_174424 [Neohortaea acidophila]|uniref:Uncharacterized protein n=1 Tax=Neohortaea acidophila TaxID=245834 RepID=A0A6A6PRU8_9PEZI|nr:uncharacterized protein BDY17DRAFT_174424 [Neohortaea acidophila]KAF2481947.1 hypothetical protein BDY17DRAFT_174424 [Neohortaea acidophila]
MENKSPKAPFDRRPSLLLFFLYCFKHFDCCIRQVQVCLRPMFLQSLDHNIKAWRHSLVDARRKAAKGVQVVFGCGSNIAPGLRALRLSLVGECSIYFEHRESYTGSSMAWEGCCFGVLLHGLGGEKYCNRIDIQGGVHASSGLLTRQCLLSLDCMCRLTEST